MIIIFATRKLYATGNWETYPIIVETFKIQRMNPSKVAESSEPRKRPRVESIETANDHEPEDVVKGLVSLEPEMKTDEIMPTPAYGSQEYWEDRYKNKTDEETQGKEGDPEPYHAWYFKFDDLAPILLPLIVGSAAFADDHADADDEENKKEENSDETLKKIAAHNETYSSSQISPQKIDSPNNLEGADEDVEQKNKNPDDVEQIDADNEKDDGGNSDAGSYEEIEGYEVDEMDEDDDRVGLAKNGPISVLEVGCGDAPLGQDLATSIQEFGSKHGSDPSKIIQKVMCLDYSKNVIDTMKQEQQQQQEQSKEKAIPVPVHYEVGDARKLSYENETFEVILEKGTLDAMLSDSDGQGQTNCRKIVSECARVLTIGGYIIIISHLNAQVESGLAWLNDVIVPGLRAAGKFEWLIEVHGSEIEIESDADEDKEVESPGPAVYFITKIGVLAQAEGSEDSEHELPTIPLKFFSY